MALPPPPKPQSGAGQKQSGAKYECIPTQDFRAGYAQRFFFR